jgi:glucosamine-6-phosphate deaminase
MKLIIKPTKQDAAQAAAQLIRDQLQQKPSSKLGLATGSTMIPVYQSLVEHNVDFSQSITFNLDEYIGVEPTDEESFHFYMRHHFSDQLTHPPRQMHVPKGVGDEEANVLQYQQLVLIHPVDLQLLGIGSNAHIGFNEPGCDFNQGVHIEHLSQSTLHANKKDLGKLAPSKAITMGIADIMRARSILVLATGEHKAQAIAAMIEGPVTNKVPASILQTHSNVTVIVDQAAASSLQRVH